EAEKREAAEAARLQAEKEAERLSQQIIEVQRQMEEMQQHITSDIRSQASLQGISQASLPNAGSTLGGGSGIFNTGEVQPRKSTFAIAGIGGVLLLLLVGGATGLYMMLGPGSGTPPPPNANSGPADRPPEVGTPGGRKSVLLEDGSFMMGRNVADPTNREWGNQYPEHTESVGRFYIDVNELTIGEYAEFVTAKPHAPPKTWPGGKPPADRLNYPVTGVSLNDAKDYALWVSTKAKKTCRLPTEIEWEYAARNLSSSTKVPWGNEWSPDRAVLAGTLAPVGTSQDRTEAGVFDMLGNVAEWTSSPYALYKGHPESLRQRTDDLFVVRGLYYRAQKELPAAFKNPDVLLTYRQSPTADDTYDTLGFRLVCDP
ncbi:MAG TPA: SUMF1/EgtB/PvdO family nonheme iron enzyme, partial [Pyrinomonadaceae bacterium]|nr:SUMF1/EgtB/PvdO family nonheme iron enzyme [Pyrinomonadaceae bacterium]